MGSDIGLNSTSLFTIAKTMREQNKEPDELMPYSEYGAASATYAVINAMESIATGLQAEERRQYEEAMERFREERKSRKEFNDMLSAHHGG